MKYFWNNLTISMETIKDMGIIVLISTKYVKKIMTESTGDEYPVQSI
jgi:hypothetical protein